MLYYAGFTRKIGDVDHGDTVMDYLPAERERGITINSASITFGWKDHLFHLIDSPGHVDFTVEVERAVRVLDGAVTILDAVSGVQAQTKTVWKQADRYGVPRIAFVNKMDRDGANWKKCCEGIETKLGIKPLICQILVNSHEEEDKILAGTAALSIKQKREKADGSGGNVVKGMVDVIDLEYLSFLDQDSSGSSITRIKLTEEENSLKCPELYDRAVEAHSQLVETLAELDHEIVEVFFSDEVDGDHLKMPASEIRAAIRRVTVKSLACPVFFGASFRNFGVQPVMDAINMYLPSPLDRPPVLSDPGTSHSSPPLEKSKSNDLSKTNKNKVQVPLDPNAPLVAFAFKVVVDQKRGQMVYVRVYSGTLNSRASLINSTRGGYKERVNKLLQMYADQPEEIPSIPVGHIGVILGLKATRTGDTLLGTDHPSLEKSLIRKSKSNKNQSLSSLQNQIGSSADMLSTGKAAGLSDGFESPTPFSGAGSSNIRPVGLQLHKLAIPPPVFFCSVEAHSPSDEKPLMDAISNLILEDPSLNVSFDPETGQTLLSGMGELHLEVIRDRLLNDMKINATVGKMQVTYRERPGSPFVNESFVYEKEIGGKLAKAGLTISIEPLGGLLDPEAAEGQEGGSGNSSSRENLIDVSNVKSSLYKSIKDYISTSRSAPTTISKSKAAGNKQQQQQQQQDIGSLASDETLEEIESAIYDGLEAATMRGTLFGFPVARTKIVVKDVFYFGPEISTVAAFRACAGLGLHNALKQSDAKLLEPIMRVTIQCEDEYIGPVISDVSRARQGRVVSLDDSNDGTSSSGSEMINRTKIAVADIPLANMVGYASTLRSLTAGNGTFTMEILGFGEMSQNQQNNVIKSLRGY
ncbi:Ribosome-releasing factor 2, mitochondrial [Mycoemilia scoparia]|uniref:Elongation factor 2 n=1 Tax=Mycoemilia scoparia TaxID=417184 RepID=A0A9W8DTF1_9FUNG|nr:Ribosome-releasing factor 2, mitochondrial [Mycoemilia scoparia]